MQAEEPLQWLQQHVHRTYLSLRAVAETTLHSEQTQKFLKVAMQQWLAAASCAASVMLLLATIAAGWVALWHTTMKDVGFFRELMGLNKPKPDVKAKMQAERAAEIERIKHQHSRSSVRSRNI